MLCILCPDVFRGPHPHLYVCMRDLELINLSHTCVSSVPHIFPFRSYRLILCQTGVGGRTLVAAGHQSV